MYKRISAITILFFLSLSAQATVILSIDDGSGPIYITDNGAGDLSPIDGIIWTGGMLGDDFYSATGFSLPREGDLMHPFLHLDSTYSSVEGGELTIGLTVTDLLGPIDSSGYWLELSNVTGGSVTLSLYVDTSNTAFGTQTLLGELGEAGGSGGQVIIGESPFSMTLFATITHYGEGISSFNAEARVPEPGTLALFGLGLFGLGLARRKKVN